MTTASSELYTRLFCARPTCVVWENSLLTPKRYLTGKIGLIQKRFAAGNNHFI